MLVKKQVTPEGVTKALYSSSNICASIFDSIVSELTIIFNHGGQYKYTGVGLTDYTRFELAESQGSILNTHIKKHATSKLENFDTTGLLAEILTLSELNDSSTIESTTNDLLETMNSIIGSYIKNGNITAVNLKGLKNNIDKYESKLTQK